MDWWPVVLVVLVAMGFTYTNGFHDAANAIATSVATRALTPRIALGLAAAMNLVGGFAGMRVAETIGADIIVVPLGAQGIVVCVGALGGAAAWNVLTWWRGLPSSSSHALVSGLAGAAVTAGATVQWRSILDKVVVPMLVSPVVGLVGGFLVMTAVLWLFRRAAPGPTARGFRYAQTVSAAAMAFGHGMQDASKTAGVVALALVASGHRSGTDDSIPWWVIALSAVVLSLGTYAGGWRIIRTLGRGIIHLDPPQGFAAEATAASILYVATATGAPVSTTHAITSAIAGVGATRSRKSVRWGMARQILVAWVLTVPGAGLAAALLVLALRPLA
ncbi:inorganic phosphate transporter [Phycicoccus sp. CSK15P-2]|uniref:inorganic phosphate transporter n=1 Tax=Phycicoccus sp. CSK15P-2 TaxID=2807627 RepID=UPI00195014DA|nr:inorganic phosphate transporter [Phycicoccus sp. CSK15P-2]MBM6403112.1 inorganic phosphate transporter [Phycicoccus sp. CSK15P-2]